MNLQKIAWVSLWLVFLVMPAQQAIGQTSNTAAVASANAPAVDVSQGDPLLGRRYFLQCQACHTLTRDGVDQTGPNLWELFGRPAGKKTGFSYSPALQQAEFSWTAQTLSHFLTNPYDFLPGTVMIFRGIPDQQMRLDLLAYLQQETRLAATN